MFYENKEEKEGEDSKKDYNGMRDWLKKLYEKKAARGVIVQATRNNHMMDSAAPPQAAAAPTGEDGWGTADPWSAAYYGEYCGQAAGQTGGTDWTLDAFGKKGGGKPGPKRPLICHICGGSAHPERLCASKTFLLNAAGERARQGNKCPTCSGTGHETAQCTSPGGAKHTPPAQKAGGKTNFYGKGMGTSWCGKQGKGMSSLENGAPAMVTKNMDMLTNNRHHRPQNQHWLRRPTRQHLRHHHRGWLQGTHSHGATTFRQRHRRS